MVKNITIASITGENGILKQVQNAKIKTKISSVEEQINLRKTANKISEEESKSDDEFIDELIQKGYVDENEVDKESKTITIEDTVISNVTNMSDMFQFCDSLTKFDCSKWNVDKVEKHNDFNYYASGVIAPNFKK